MRITGKIVTKIVGVTNGNRVRRQSVTNLFTSQVLRLVTD